MIDNLNFLSQNKENLPLDIIRIDDDFQKELGDWTLTSDNFPGEMDELAKKIKESGFIPGLWLEPFLASAESQLFSENPDWFVKNNKGEPLQALKNPDWGFRKGFHSLDLTNKEVQDYLRGLLKTIVHKWVYSYLKLDFYMLQP